MSRDLFAMWMAANGLAVAFFCWARYVIFWRDRGRHPVRRHPGAKRRRVLDSLLGIE